MLTLVQVVDDWEGAEDSEAEAEKAKKAAEAKARAEAEAAKNKKPKAQRIEEQRMERMRRKVEEDEETSSEEEDERTKRERLRRTEQEADLKHAEDLFGNIGINKNRSAPKAVVNTDPNDPSKAVDISSLPLFNPTTKEQFLKLRETLTPILAANSKKAQYTSFMQEFTKQIVKELPSEQIKKIASGLATLSNEKMKEEKAAEKGGKKTKAAKSKASLVANRDASHRADTTVYDDLGEFSSKELGSVGNYTLGRLIGKGSFGKVYLASHKLTNGSKVVLKSAKKDDTTLAREIHHHRQFLHPHIARLYEVIVTENLVWLVLEYCPGDELYNYLLHHGPIPPEKVQKIFTQLVGAVTYVHNMSCVHRDLKLENILLDKHENVKLCDFGFTREYDGKMSYLQTFCGTVCYSAPEMLKGEKYAGEKVDVWSLGIILFALLTGELPFDDDNEMVTKRKILTTDLTYPDSVPADAKALISQLLSKRPLLRPTLADILTNPFLAEHAPQQQAILKLTQPPPFGTDLERQTLERMRSAGIDIDKVIENVLAQRCDPLAGWWALLIEKEQRKEKRRERKRKERELEAKNQRRLSTASSRVERVSAPLKEVDENGLSPPNTDGSRRGRRDRRSLGAPQLVLPELPKLPEGTVIDSPQSATPPPPIEKDPGPNVSLNQQRPQPPPKERRRSRGSTLQMTAKNQDYLAPPNGMPKGRLGRRSSRHPLINQLASIKHWFVDSAKRAKSPSNKSEVSTLKPPLEKSPKEARNSPIISQSKSQSPAVSTPPQQHHQQQPRTTYIAHARITTPHSRASLSPAPLTPRSSYRHSSAGTIGLRGRKSTSSSVSSIRSIHHVHTHSKASSTSSTSNSVHSSAFPSINSATRTSGRSPHSSVKVLPSTPTATTFPSNIRLVRGPPSNNLYNESAFPPPSTITTNNGHSNSLIFAKRKKTPFRGPMLSLNASSGFTSQSGHGSASANGSGSPAPHHRVTAGREKNGGSSGSRSASQVGRRSGEIIEEEDEDEVEEVDAFSPVGAGMEETVWEEGDLDPDLERESRSGDWVRTKGKGG
ncbi:MAG: hypothetical protein Q9171_000768 [Xanthocarpia ochracea]